MSETTLKFLNEHLLGVMHSYETGHLAYAIARLKACIAQIEMENGSGMLPLFVPLRREYFEQFKSGQKTWEYRRYGRKWNEFTCAISRPVVLSLGYGKEDRLCGEIVSFRKESDTAKLPGWSDVYGPSPDYAACIEIRLWRSVETVPL